MLLSRHTWRRFLEGVGALFLILQTLDWFGWISSEYKTQSAMWLLIAPALLYGLSARFPVRSVRYKPSKKDYSYEIRIGDLFESPESVVVSTSTTFDTDISSGLIAADSLQGQLTQRLLNGKTDDLDRQISAALKGLTFSDAVSPGKRKRYPIGTVAHVTINGKCFYFLAMSELNQSGNARMPPGAYEEALVGLWNAVAERGELGDLALPAIGTGRGRLNIPRQKIVETIAQSFAYASAERKIANKLTIVITPGDAEKYGVNLFQLKDYLTLSLDT